VHFYLELIQHPAGLALKLTALLRAPSSTKRKGTKESEGDVSKINKLKESR